MKRKSFILFCLIGIVVLFLFFLTIKQYQANKYEVTNTNNVNEVVEDKSNIEPSNIEPSNNDLSITDNGIEKSVEKLVEQSKKSLKALFFILFIVITFSTILDTILKQRI